MWGGSSEDHLNRICRQIELEEQAAVWWLLPLLGLNGDTMFKYGHARLSHPIIPIPPPCCSVLGLTTVTVAGGRVYVRRDIKTECIKKPTSIFSETIESVVSIEV